MLKIVDAGAVELASSDLRYGRGLFESIRVTEASPWRLGLHLERLAAGASFFKLGEVPSVSAVSDYLARHGTMPPGGAGVLRLYAFDGRLAMGFVPGLPPMPERPSACIAESIVRFSASPLSRFKTMSYLENSMLSREAERCGCFDALALNERGAITDGGRTNLFVICGDQVFTPPVADGALPGISRGIILAQGLAKERSLLPAYLAQCQAAFLTNALRLVVPLDSLCGMPMDVFHPAIAAARESLHRR